MFHLLNALNYYQIPINPKSIIDGGESQNINEQEGMDEINRLLETKEPFTAVIALNDLMAAGAIRELKNHNSTVPGDVSVIGCDNTALSKIFNPEIATIDIQAFTVGELLMYQLNRKIKHKNPIKRIITSTFIERESIVQTKQVRKEKYE